MLPWIIAILALLTAFVLAVLALRLRADVRAGTANRAHQQQVHAQASAQAELLKNAIMKGVEDALLILDTNLTIVETNEAAQRMFGQQLAGKTLMSALRQPDLEALFHDARRVRSETVERRIELNHRIFHARALALPASGVEFEIMTLRDVTQLQRLERARREMVSNISHELSTPITSIGLLAETLLNVAEREKPKRLRKMAKDIRRETDTLMHLVQEMRDLSLIESGQMPIRLTPTPLLPIVTSTLQQLESLAENKQQAVTVEVPADIAVLADEVQIQRALKNILHNAIKFTPNGGHIRISARRGDAEAVLAVSDDGPGIPAEDLSRIFERFFQVDRARREGTGLGLAIVRHIVRAHGGRTWAESVQGEGATFYIALSLAGAEPADTPDTPDVS
ncbi:MAG: PAS domain-containing protein [Chloroflexota bacterium]|jgi:two-component system phosphate regulon sensor histidine kinase PhoR